MVVNRDDELVVSHLPNADFTQLHTLRTLLDILAL